MLVQQVRSVGKAAKSAHKRPRGFHELRSLGSIPLLEDLFEIKGCAHEQGIGTHGERKRIQRQVRPPQLSHPAHMGLRKQGHSLANRHVGLPQRNKIANAAMHHAHALNGPMKRMEQMCVALR